MRVWILAAVLLAVALHAHAAEYKGWGDTGWTQYSKRACCDLAIELAQEDSIERCMTAGGVPRVRRGMRRGACEWQSLQDGWGDIVYRCKARTSVGCRQ
jgi:hypothetical protein